MRLISWFFNFQHLHTLNTMANIQGVGLASVNVSILDSILWPMFKVYIQFGTSTFLWD